MVALLLVLAASAGPQIHGWVFEIENGRVVRASFSTGQRLRNGPWSLADWLRVPIRLVR